MLITLFNPKRRHFFRALVAETIAWMEEFSGRPQLRLDELKSVPDEILLEMVPVFNARNPSRIEDGWLVVRNMQNGGFNPYLRLGEHETYILACFDGFHSIEGICNRLQTDFKLNQTQAFDRVKRLFVQLAEAGVCHPSGGIG